MTLDIRNSLSFSANYYPKNKFSSRQTEKTYIGSRPSTITPHRATVLSNHSLQTNDAISKNSMMNSNHFNDPIPVAVPIRINNYADHDKPEVSRTSSHPSNMPLNR